MRTIYFRKRFKKYFAKCERVKRDMQRFEEVLSALKGGDRFRQPRGIADYRNTHL